MIISVNCAELNALFMSRAKTASINSIHLIMVLVVVFLVYVMEAIIQEL